MENNLIQNESRLNLKTNLLKKGNNKTRTKHNYFLLFFLIIAALFCVYLFYGENSDAVVGADTTAEEGVGGFDDYLDDSDIFREAYIGKKTDWLAYSHTGRRNFTIRYDKEDWDYNYCGVKWEPYFNRDAKWATHEELGHHYWSHHWLLAKKYRHIFDLIQTRHWEVTHDPKMMKKIEVFTAGRYIPPRLEPKGKDISKRFTITDGFVQRGLGKNLNLHALDAVLDTHKCDWRRLKFYQPDQPEEYNAWCHEAKKHPKTTWLYKPKYGSRGDGMRIMSRKSIDYHCRKNHPRRNYTFVVQEFMHDTFLLEGYKFHIRFMGFIIAHPFVTYWAPRFSFFRMSNHKYSLKSRNAYLDNTGECDDNMMGCYIYDSDFIKQGGVDEAKWKKAVSKMIPMSHLMMKAYYGRNIFEGNVGKKRFTWVGFDYMIDKNWNPVFTEWNEEPGVFNQLVPIMQVRMSDFFDGMFSIVRAYHTKRPQIEIDGIANKYQMARAKLKSDKHWEKWVLPIPAGKLPVDEYVDVNKLLRQEPADEREYQRERAKRIAARKREREREKKKQKRKREAEKRKKLAEKQKHKSVLKAAKDKVNHVFNKVIGKLGINKKDAKKKKNKNKKKEDKSKTTKKDLKKNDKSKKAKKDLKKSDKSKKAKKDLKKNDKSKKAKKDLKKNDKSKKTKKDLKKKKKVARKHK